MRSFREGVQIQKFKDEVVGIPVFRNHRDEEERTKKYVKVGLVK